MKSHERGEIAVRPALPSPHDRRSVRRPLHFECDFSTDLECIDADVRTDRRNELFGIVRQGVDRFGHDLGDRPTPARVHCGDVSSRRMREEHRNAIGGARCNTDTLASRHQGIAFAVGDELGRVGLGDFPNVRPVNLSLLEEPCERNAEHPRKS